MPVSAQRGHDDFFFSRFLAGHGLANCSGNGVSGFGCGHDAFGASKFQRAVEAFGLRNGDRLDQAQLVNVRDQRCHTVITQAASVDRFRDKRGAERVHFHQWSETCRVSKVIAILALGQGGAGRGLYAADHRVHFARQLFAEEREGQPTKV